MAEEGGEAQNHPAVMVMERVNATPDTALPVQQSEVVLSPPSLIRERLQEIVAEAADGELVPIAIEVEHDEPGRQFELDRAMATGLIATRQDYYDYHDIFLDERRERVAAKQAPVVEAIEAAGGVVTYRCKIGGCILADVPAGAVLQLGDLADVKAIDTTDATSASTYVSGTETRDGAQLRMHLDGGYDGSGPGVLNDDLTAAVIELGKEGPSEDLVSFLPDHGGYKQNSGTAFRFPPIAPDTGMWECDNQLGDGDCDPVSTFEDPAGYHPTSVAGVVFGDLVDGQIAAILGADRERGSGYGPEARAHLYLANGDGGYANATLLAADHIRSLGMGSWPPEVVSMSYKFDLGDCDGDSEIALSVNELYLDGFAVVAGANNDGGSSSDCRVRPPGDALGSFTVGAHLSSENAGSDALTVRTAAIYNDGVQVSAWGGNNSEGQNRSIVSITGPGRRQGRLLPDGTVQLNSSVGNTGAAATSLATATVSGASLAVMDYHMRTGSSWIGNPGNLYAALLVMGDRQKSSGGKGFAGVDHRWGVGRLRVRMLGPDGLDAPFSWYHAVTCIAHNEVYDFYLFENPPANDINAVKASAFWYDNRHEDNGTVANIDLAIIIDGDVLPIVFDTDPDDNKAFVMLEDAPNDGENFRLRIAGTNVQGHNDPTCGNNAMKVHFIIFAEDSDRESPTYNAGTGIGVAPEDI